MDRPDHLGEPVRRLAGFLLAIGLVPAVALAGQVEFVTPPSRDVTAPGMMPAEVGSGPLVRVPTPPRPPDPPRWRRYILPETTDAATFLIPSLTIHVAGVEPLRVDATCALADGTNWPCGETALYALRRFLHGRPVECLHTLPGTTTEIDAPCRVGQTDLATWLVENGWARPRDETEAHLALTQARCTGRGMWRGEPRPEGCPELAASSP